jgi:hypothetical protein
MSIGQLIRSLFGRQQSEPRADDTVRFEGGDGSSWDNAVVVRGAALEFEGIAATFAWIEHQFGPKNVGWKLVSHSSGGDEHRKIDTFDIAVADGSKCRVFFDVTESFGKR